MGLFNSKPITPTVPSILPPVAKQQILSGRLPVLQPNNLFLKEKETLHFADRAIYEKRMVRKRRVQMPFQWGKVFA